MRRPQPKTAPRRADFPSDPGVISSLLGPQFPSNERGELRRWLSPLAAHLHPESLSSLPGRAPDQPGCGGIPAPPPRVLLGSLRALRARQAVRKALGPPPTPPPHALRDSHSADPFVLVTWAEIRNPPPVASGEGGKSRGFSPGRSAPGSWRPQPPSDAPSGANLWKGPAMMGPRLEKEVRMGRRIRGQKPRERRAPGEEMMSPASPDALGAETSLHPAG